MTGANAAAPQPSFRTFLLLWSTQTISLFGTFITQFAINIWLTRDLYPLPTQRTPLALALTVMTLASSAPLILGMPIAGAFADRHDRRLILFVANMSSALLTGAMLALLITHHLPLWLAAILLVGYSLAGSFHSAAFDSSYGLLVRPEQLGRANGMMQTSFALSQLLAPAVAATLIGLPSLLAHGQAAPAWLGHLSDGVPFAFAADMCTFLIAAIAIASLRIPSPPPRKGPRASLAADVREGIHWIVKRKPFVWLLQFGALANFSFAPLVLLLPLLVRDRLATDRAAHHLSYEATLAIVSTAMGAGGVLGGVIMSTWGGVKRQRTYAMVLSMIVLGAGVCVAGLSRQVWVMAAALFICEIPVPMLNGHSYLLWQSLVPSHLLARVLSTRRFIAQSAFPVGTMIAGWLAAGIEPWMLVSGFTGVLVLYCLVNVLDPNFRTLEARMAESAAYDVV